MFNKGNILKDINGKQITIVEHLGGGGQGDVYKVKYGEEHKAFKWIKNAGKKPLDFYENIKINIEKGSPSSCFLWPEAITVLTKNNQFGYIMPLRPAGYYDVSEFLLARQRFPSFKACVKTCINIINSFRSLHKKGFSYQDINDGNFFINPQTADVLIVDTDNVAPYGKNLGVIGKPRYMAPEIVLNKSKPNVQSDKFSLSVIMFMLLVNAHPLEGKQFFNIPCLTNEDAKKIYGSHATFIFDDVDQSNCAITLLHKTAISRWKYLPNYIKQTFAKAFSKDVLNDENKRINELEWLKVLTRFEGDIIKCQCGNEIFIDTQKDINICDGCNKSVKGLNKFKLPNYCLAIEKGLKLYRCQIELCDIEKALDVIVSVGEQKNIKGENILAFRNMTSKPLDCITSTGMKKQLKPLEFAPIKKGIRIVLNKNEIEII